MICLGFTRVCRRSELVGLDVEDLIFSDDGLEVTIRRSKTDQESWGARWVSHTAVDPAPALFRLSGTGSTHRCSGKAPFPPINRFGKNLAVAADWAKRERSS